MFPLRVGHHASSTLIVHFHLLAEFQSLGNSLAGRLRGAVPAKIHFQVLKARLGQGVEGHWFYNGCEV